MGTNAVYFLRDFFDPPPSPNVYFNPLSTKVLIRKFSDWFTQKCIQKKKKN